MATYSGVCSAVGGFSYANRFTLYVELTNKNGNSATNQSIVDYNVYLENTSGGGTFTSNTRLYFAMNGVIVRDETLNVTGPRDGRISIASGSMTVNHNNDGTKTIGFQALVQSTNYGVSCNVQKDFTLTTIPRASKISASTANIGENTQITITSASSSFRHSVYVHFGALQYVDFGQNKAGGTYSWQVPTSFYAQIPNAKEGKGTITCETYNNDVFIGSHSVEFKATTNINTCRPTVTGTVVDTNSTTIALTGNSNKLIKGKSTAKITVTPSAKNSATIKTVKIDGVTTTNNTRTISNVSKASFPIEVTDSREYPSLAYSATASGGIVNYVPLSINANFFRPQPTTGEIQLTYSGNYFNGSFGATSNTLSISWKYRVQGASSWTNGGTITPTLSGNTISSKTISLGTSYGYQTAYEFQLTATDKLGTVTQTAKVSVGMPVFYWGKDFFDVNVDTKFRGNANVLGNLVISHNVQGGNVPIGSTLENVLFGDVGAGKGLNKNFIGSVYSSSTWYNLINIRHRNGNTDGTKYGMQIRKPLATLNGPIEIRGQANDAWGDWEQIPRYKVLYNNSSGTTGTVTLSETSANFAYIEIIYYLSTSAQGKLYKSTGKISGAGNVVLDMNRPVGTAQNQCVSEIVIISGTSITRSTKSFFTNNEGTIPAYGNSISFNITKVVGYR